MPRPKAEKPTPASARRRRNSRLVIAPLGKGIRRIDDEGPLGEPREAHVELLPRGERLTARAVASMMPSMPARHPLEPLDADEIRAASAILRAAGHLRDRVRVIGLTLREPARDDLRRLAAGQALAIGRSRTRTSSSGTPSAPIMSYAPRTGRSCPRCRSGSC
jgi:Cu2+-containing amine oxidase